jgi:plasmid stability protein
MKATFVLDDDLYRAVKVAAALTDRSVKDIVEEALAAWLEAAEAAADRAAAAAALDEYQAVGGESAEAWFGRLAAEAHAAYGTSSESIRPAAASTDRG